MSQRLEMMAASIGYGDRLAFATASVGALADILPIWLPVLYLSLPALAIVAAMFEAGVGRRLPSFLFATALVFAIDLAASITAIVTHAARRPYRWYSPRLEHVDGDSNA
jgi:hypothetical protein